MHFGSKTGDFTPDAIDLGLIFIPEAVYPFIGRIYPGIDCSEFTFLFELNAAKSENK